MDYVSVFVTDVAALQPAGKRGAVGVRADRLVPAKVHVRPGQQHRCAIGPALQHPLLLAANFGLQLIVDRDKRLSLHLVVGVAQIGCAVAVGDHAGEGEFGASEIRSPQRIKISVVSR